MATNSANDLRRVETETTQPTIRFPEKRWARQTVIRAILWTAAASAALLADIVTKAAPHSVVAHNHSYMPLAVMAMLAALLVAIGLGHSRLLAIGTGLMFGGLCGNGGETLLYGYASDWLPVDGWLTNVSDVSGAIGILCCFAGYLWNRHGSIVRRKSKPLIQ